MPSPTTKMHWMLNRGTALAAVAGITTLGALSSARAGDGYYGGGGAGSVVEIERARLMQQFEEAMMHFEAGIEYYNEEKYEDAVNEFEQAYDLMPRGPRTEEHVASLEAWYCRAMIELAYIRARDEARYDDARKLAERSVEICPDNDAAVEFLEKLENHAPELGEFGRTPEHMSQVAEVNDLLYLGESQVRIGRLDDATETYHRVLNIDPYNSAARNGLERSAQERLKYNRSAYNHARAELLARVEDLWNLPSYAETDREIGPGSIRPGRIDDGDGGLRRRLEQITLDVDFSQASLDEVVEFLRLESRAEDPSGAGVNIVLDLSADTLSAAPAAAAPGPFGGGTPVAAPVAAPSGERLVTLQLSGVTMIDLLEFITEQTDTAYSFERGVIVIRSGGGGALITETFAVPPNFVDSLSESGGGGGGAAVSNDPFGGGGNPFGGGTTASTGGGGARGSAQDALTAAGVDFSTPGSKAVFNRALSTLTITNTASNLEVIEDLIEEIRLQGPKQVHITTRFVEVQQRNEDELGFDWLLGAFNLPGTDRAFGSGGTAGNGRGVDGLEYPFVYPGGGGQPVGTNPLGRLRSGDGAIRAGAIDSILNTSASAATTLAPAPGLISLAGVFTDPQFQVVIRALNQSTGVDLMTAPSIVAASGQTGKIEVIREFIYPGDYDPPELPTNVGGNSTFSGNDGGGLGLPGVGAVGQVTSFPVTPATPTDWTTRPTGVILDVTPTVSNDNFTISLDLKPQVVEFEGFINYGNPIQSPAVNSLGQPVSVTITENRIQQPIFSTRKVETLVTVYDNSTVAIGGLMREDIQQIEDKLPLLGDIPIVGRLFQSRAESRFKRNLIVFVTAQLIGPDGRPLAEDKPLEEPPAPLDLDSGEGVGIAPGARDLLMK